MAPPSPAPSCRGRDVAKGVGSLGGGRPRGVRSRFARRLHLNFSGGSLAADKNEAIYQALYIQRGGAFRGGLTACPRTGRAHWAPRAHAHGWGKGFVAPEVLILAPRGEVADRGPGPLGGRLLHAPASPAADAEPWHHDAARATPGLADVGSEHGDGAARAPVSRHGTPGLLLRPARPVATRHQHTSGLLRQSFPKDGLERPLPLRRPTRFLPSSPAHIP
jgi:hypothetical protein